MASAIDPPQGAHPANVTQVMGRFRPWNSPPESIEGDRTYRLLEELGEGGMGVVYLAERADGEYRQQVAVKLLRDAHQGEQRATRFRTERQILAALDHPYIAKLLDGGTLASGAPFLVMEYVEGLPIDRYCARNALALRDRLELFLKVCSAVSAAHQRLIVHRDLKPENILVNQAGDPKLLDFGIAKLLDAEATGWTVAATEFGSSPLTPRYASPEQVRGEPISTASDIFSLGVVLYELLTGRLPYPESDLATLQLMALICERDPPAPSTAAAALPLRLPSQAAEPLPYRLQELEGDLDAIVAKALRKEPAERYASVELLAADLRAYLEGQPVAARRGSRLYRASKFLRRHRLAAAGAAVLLATLVGWGWTTRVQLARTRDQRDQAQQVTRLLLDLFTVVDPEEGQGEQVTAREVLDRAAARIGPELGGRPAVRAELEEAVGRVYSQLGLYERAQPLLDSALALRRQGHGDPLSTLYQLGNLAARRGDRPRAEQYLEEALRRAEARPGSSPGLAEVETSLAELRFDQGNYPLSEQHYLRALAALAPGEGVAKAQILANLARLALEQGRPEEASSRLKEAEALADAGLPGQPWRSAMALNDIGLVLDQAGDARHAGEVLRRALEVYRRILPGDHADVASSLNNLGGVYLGLGELATAQDFYRQSAEMLRRLLGDRNPKLLTPLGNLAVAQMQAGDFAAAERSLREVEALAREISPEDQASLAIYDSNLGDALREQHREAEAETFYRRALVEQLAAFGDGSPAVARTRLRLARLAWGRGERAGVRKTVEDCLSILKQKLPPDHPQLASAYLVASRLDQDEGRWAQAEAELREARRIFAARQPPDEAQMANAESLLGELLTRRGERAQGLELLRSSLARLSSTLGPRHPRTLEAEARLARAEASGGG
ncbi:MAG: serine/threonine-protein kinase [Thermoanaerobaculia bacterium]